MQERREEAWSLRRTARELNERGVPTVTRAAWDHSTVRRILLRAEKK
jgi:hypothetical protein